MCVFSHELRIIFLRFPIENMVMLNILSGCCMIEFCREISRCFLKLFIINWTSVGVIVLSSS